MKLDHCLDVYRFSCFKLRTFSVVDKRTKLNVLRFSGDVIDAHRVPTRLNFFLVCVFVSAPRMSFDTIYKLQLKQIYHLLTFMMLLLLYF